MLDMAPRHVVRSKGNELVTAELTDDDVRWSFDRVTDRLVDLVLGRTTENPSPGEQGARVVEILDGMYRSAASGEFAGVSRG
jgi:predicted dehydrogenase